MDDPLRFRTPIANVGIAHSDGEIDVWTSSGDARDEEDIPHFDREAVCEVVDHLWDLHSQGVILVGWNTAGFDWRCLYEQAQDIPTMLKVKELAANTVDLMIWIWYNSGYPVKLGGAARAMLPNGKLLDGSAVSELWADPIQRTTVDEYVASDAAITRDILTFWKENSGSVGWYTNSGSLGTFQNNIMVTPKMLLQTRSFTKANVKYLANPRRPINWIQEATRVK
jgi:hypothetical protein